MNSGKKENKKYIRNLLYYLVETTECYKKVIYGVTMWDYFVALLLSVIAPSFLISYLFWAGFAKSKGIIFLLFLLFYFLFTDFSITDYFKNYVYVEIDFEEGTIILKTLFGEKKVVKKDEIQGVVFESEKKGNKRYVKFYLTNGEKIVINSSIFSMKNNEKGVFYEAVYSLYFHIIKLVGREKIISYQSIIEFNQRLFKRLKKKPENRNTEHIFNLLLFLVYFFRLMGTTSEDYYKKFAKEHGLPDDFPELCKQAEKELELIISEVKSNCG